MEMLTNKEVMPLTLKLTGKEDNQITYKIKEAILGEVNQRLGINAQSVLKVLLNGLKMPKESDITIEAYVKKATIWVIEHRRSIVQKPIGKFVDMLKYYNDFRNNKYEMNNLEKKYFEYLCYHIAYENPFLSLEELEELHQKCLNQKTFKEYLSCFEKHLITSNIPLPKEVLMEKAKRNLKEWEEILKELDE